MSKLAARSTQPAKRSGSSGKGAMNGFISSTSDYYIHGIDTLGWELTVCNALYPANSPCRRILKRNDSYGNLLYDYLGRFLPMGEIRSVIEIGGGYGYLMRDFLTKSPSLKVTMLEISPFLSKKQRETLEDHTATYIVEDFLDTGIGMLSGKDMAVLNENLGDFPTLVNIRKGILRGSFHGMEEHTEQLRRLFDTYGFEEPQTEPFTVNMGAIEAVERLCLAGIPYIFVGEHSCEARVPDRYRGVVRVSSDGNPEKIALRGHDEYTIKFSHLEKVARSFHYRTIRGPFADFLEIDFNDRIRNIMSSPFAVSDEHEIIRQFVEDLYQYEYLILLKYGGDYGRA